MAAVSTFCLLATKEPFESALGQNMCKSDLPPHVLEAMGKQYKDVAHHAHALVRW
jgi:hypothetical protein